MKSEFCNIIFADAEKISYLNDSIKIFPGKECNLLFKKVVIKDKKISDLFGFETFETYLPDLNFAIDDCDSELLVTNHSGKKITIIGIKDKNVIVNFNYNKFEDYLLNERYLHRVQPLYTKFPFPYYKVPVLIRNVLFSLLLKIKLIHKRIKQERTFPQWPIEPCLDIIRWIIWSNAASIKNIKPKKTPYGRMKKSLVLLTHDVETFKGIKNIEKLRKIERRYNMVSSWSIVSNRYKIDEKILKKLITEGCEIISHGYKHDGLLPYRCDDEINKRLNHIFQTKFWLKNHIKGFRSPHLLRNEKLSKILSKYFNYDLTKPDTEKLTTMGNYTGCCTVYPFINAHGVLEIPLTIPQDFLMRYIYKYTSSEIVNLWIKKIEYIEKINGISVISTHPDPYICTKEMIGVYDRLLNYLSKKETIKILTPFELYQFIKKLN